MLNTQEVITKLLRNLGSRKEVEQYLRQFSSVESQKFAVIRVSGAVIQKDLDGLVSSLAFLQAVGLYPLVVHGAGPQLDEALAQAGIKTSRMDGLRVTPPEAMEVVKKVMQRENLRVADALEKLGTRARPIAGGVFEAEAADQERLGLVGHVKAVNMDAVMSAINAGSLPIIASLGETRGGQILNINSVVGARALAHVVEPFKVVFLTQAGGLLNADGQVISAINLMEDGGQLLEQPWLTASARLKLKEIRLILEKLPSTSSVSITAPDQLARELFTYKGSGTLVRMGDRIRTYDSLEGIDQARLQLLLEDSFGRPLKPGYFNKKFFRIYLADSYRACAILTKEFDIPYLDKFAATQEAQGIGVGGSIWRAMVKDNPRLYWRARKDNPVNPWYFENAQGSYQSDRWTVFWYGLNSFDEARHCIEHAVSLPTTLVDAPASRS